MEILPVPYALQAELDWQPRTTRRRLTELLTKKVGAPHLDAENPELQELFCGLSEEIAAAVAKRDTLPDPDHMRRVAEKAVAKSTTSKISSSHSGSLAGGSSVRCAR